MKRINHRRTSNKTQLHCQWELPQLDQARGVGRRRGAVQGAGVGEAQSRGKHGGRERRGVGRARKGMGTTARRRRAQTLARGMGMNGRAQPGLEDDRTRFFFPQISVKWDVEVISAVDFGIEGLDQLCAHVHQM